LKDYSIHQMLSGATEDSHVGMDVP